MFRTQARCVRRNLGNAFGFGLVVLSLVAAAPSQAQSTTTAYSNFGPRDTYDADGRGYGIGPSLVGFSNYLTAFEFTSTGSGVVDSYDAGIARAPVSGGNSPFVFRLYTSNGGALGSLLDIAADANIPAVSYNAPAIYNLASVSHPTLTAGTAYWLLASSVNTSYGWIIAASDTASANTLASGDGGTSFHTNSQTPSAYRVNLGTLGTLGNLGATATPEPESGLFLAIAGVPAVGIIVRPRRKSA